MVPLTKLMCDFWQLLVRKMHQTIEKVDEERYDMEAKVAKTNKEVIRPSFQVTIYLRISLEVMLLRLMCL